MIIRKLFEFECAHRVYGAYSSKCATGLHGHSYKLEVLLESDVFYDSQMILDFTRLKDVISPFIDSFDHSVVFSNTDPEDYKKSIKETSLRWIQMPFSPTAEQMARLFFTIFHLKLSEIGASELLHSIILHETRTGYVQCFKEDAMNKNFGVFYLGDIEFSPKLSDWNILI